MAFDLTKKIYRPGGKILTVDGKVHLRPDQCCCLCVLFAAAGEDDDVHNKVHWTPGLGAHYSDGSGMAWDLTWNASDSSWYLTFTDAPNSVTIKQAGLPGVRPHGYYLVSFMTGDWTYVSGGGTGHNLTGMDPDPPDCSGAKDY